MLRAKNIWVAGGDPRQAALAELLADDGHSVHTYALERAEGMKCEPSMEGADRADCVVLPVEFSDEVLVLLDCSEPLVKSVLDKIPSPAVLPHAVSKNIIKTASNNVYIFFIIILLSSSAI